MQKIRGIPTEALAEVGVLAVVAYEKGAKS